MLGPMARGTNLDDLLESGWEALGEGDLEAAAAAHARALKKAPDEPAVIELGGLITASRGDVPGGVAALERAAELAPDDPSPLLHASEVLLYSSANAEAALDACDRALERISEEPDFVDAALIKAACHLELEQPQAAAGVLAELDNCTIDDVDQLISAGTLFADAGDLPRAARAFERAITLDPDAADAHHGLGRVCELRGDRPGMIAAWLRTRELDLAAEPLPWALDEDQFAEVAEAAMEELPEQVIRHLENVPVLIDDVPSEDLIHEGLDPRLLGLFSGLPLPHKSHITEQSAQIDSVHLYKRNLERFARSDDELAEEIRITVLHETAHFFGLEDEDLEDLGLG